MNKSWLISHLHQKKTRPCRFLDSLAEFFGACIVFHVPIICACHESWYSRKSELSMMPIRYVSSWAWAGKVEVEHVYFHAEQIIDDHWTVCRCFMSTIDEGQGGVGRAHPSIRGPWSGSQPRSAANDASYAGRTGIKSLVNVNNSAELLGTWQHNVFNTTRLQHTCFPIFRWVNVRSRGRNENWPKIGCLVLLYLANLFWWYWNHGTVWSNAFATVVHLMSNLEAPNPSHENELRVYSSILYFHDSII